MPSVTKVATLRLDSCGLEEGAPLARLLERASDGLTEVSLAQNELRDAEVPPSRGKVEWAEGNT